MAADREKSSRLGRYWPAVKWTFFAVVLLFIGRRAIQLWNDSPPVMVSIKPLWLIAAGLTYFVGWLPSVWFWKALLKATGQSANVRDLLQAYYVGNVGKYIPGKALVIVIRATMMETRGVNVLLAGVTAVAETLVFMATGAALALALCPLAFGDSFWSQLPSQLSSWRAQPTLTFAVAIVGLFATTPISARLVTKAARKFTASDLPTSVKAPYVSTRMMSAGILVTSLGWCCHALSLGFVFQSISDQSFDITQFPLWLEAVTMSVFGGFVVLIAPGGLGVREALLVEAIKNHPHVGPATAIIVAGLLRAVWFVTELIAAGALFIQSITDHRRPRVETNESSVIDNQDRGNVDIHTLDADGN